MGLLLLENVQWHATRVLPNSMVNNSFPPPPPNPARDDISTGIAFHFLHFDWAPDYNINITYNFDSTKQFCYTDGSQICFFFFHQILEILIYRLRVINFPILALVFFFFFLRNE